MGSAPNFTTPGLAKPVARFKMKRLFLGWIFFCVCGTANAATINAASLAYADVTNAIGQAVNGDMVMLPAGTNSWSNTVAIAKGIILRGAGIGKTVIIDQMPDANTDGLTDGPILTWSMAAGQYHRMTGIEFQDGSVGAINYNGVITVSGLNTDNRRIRIDHCRFTQLQGFSVWFYTCLGVMDHCYVDAASGRIPFNVFHTGWNGVGFSDGSWADPSFWGTENFLFFEDTYFTQPTPYAIIDAFQGARYVVRYSTIVRGWCEAHGTDSGGRVRGTRAIEVYNNHFIGDNTSSIFVNVRSGTALVHDNTITNFYITPIILTDTYRTFFPFPIFQAANGTNAWDINYPGGPFETGIATAGSGQHLLVDTNKAWTPSQWVGYTCLRTNVVDGNYNSSIITANTTTSITTRATGGFAAQFGYAELTFAAGNGYQIWRVTETIDQPGRSGGTQLSGATPSVPVGWNDQVDDPMYEWNNTEESGNPGFSVGSPLIIRANEHYFVDTALPGYTPYTYPHPLTTEDKVITITSVPILGTGITVSPSDLNSETNGATTFARRYMTNEVVTLTAPAANFSKWQMDGVDYTNAASFSFTATTNRTFAAIYTNVLFGTLNATTINVP